MRKPPAESRMKLTVISVIAVEFGGRLDCEDTEEAHVWVETPLWSSRRAFLTGASPFTDAAQCTPEELPNRYFLAELPADPPPSRPEDTTGERLEWPGLREAPTPPPGWMAGHSSTGRGPERAAEDACQRCGACNLDDCPACTGCQCPASTPRPVGPAEGMARWPRRRRRPHRPQGAPVTSPVTEHLPGGLVETVVQEVGCPLPCLSATETRRLYRNVLAAVLPELHTAARRAVTGETAELHGRIQELTNENSDLAEQLAAWEGEPA
ncbi:hypothetical protein RM572_00740 [Streptomyces sp. DSM 42041]|uniref:Uncharacterized protein n=1 Tax=Streptomyces hazeniae TaxID=3075538 RepID=A0ABU2NLF4_9ACTN|nr:hypothetical protein [Streptomyces sp. DSM 42041]MDT0377302.1 hypothetical protein [Streptomyces sp. DSM 42041]